MSQSRSIIKQQMNDLCGQALSQLDQQEQEIEEAISEVVTRRAELTRKREVFISLLEKSRLEHKRAAAASLSPTPPQHYGRCIPSAPPSSSLSRKRTITFEDEFAHNFANAPVENLLETAVVKRKKQRRTQARYQAILGEIAEQVTNDGTATLDTDLPQSVSSSLAAFEPQNPFAEFAKVSGDTYFAYRLAAGDQGDVEKIPRCNEYFTRQPILSRESRFQPVIYILNMEAFLKTFYDEIRHVESCLQYQAANWKTGQAKIVMNESYHILVHFIDEILKAYSPALQAPSAHGSSAGSPSHVRIRDAEGNEQIVEIKQLSQKGNRLFLDRTEVTFAGYLSRDINIHFSGPNL